MMYVQCPGVDGWLTQTAHVGTVTISTDGGIVMTEIYDGTIVLGPIVITSIDAGMLMLVAVLGINGIN